MYITYNYGRLVEDLRKRLMSMVERKDEEELYRQWEVFRAWLLRELLLTLKLVLYSLGNAVVNSFWNVSNSKAEEHFGPGS